MINIAGFVIALLLLRDCYSSDVILQAASSFIMECVCLAVIALTTGVGHWMIAARMRALRAAMVLPIDQIAADDPRRIAFNALHGYSVKALGLAMIAALVAMVLMARSLRQLNLCKDRKSSVDIIEDIDDWRRRFDGWKQTALRR